MTVWNPSGQPGDQIGDACQCGDVSTPATDNAGIGYVNQTDVGLIRNALAEQANLDPGIALRCNVNGLLNHVEQGGLPTDCEISDAMAILRVLDGLDMAGDNLQQCVAP